MSIVIHDCEEAHLPEVQAIYALEVLEGTASFETEPPDVEEIRRRYRKITESGLPYLVAIEMNAVVGYCYASPYRARAAYQYSVENSVYVASWARRRGVGLILLNALLEKVEAGPWRQMVAVIGGSAHTASIKLHEQAGFRQVGVLKDVDFKFGEWVDTVIMQRAVN